MSRHTRQAISLLGAASIALQTIRDSFTISPVLVEKINMADQWVRDTAKAWPGRFDGNDGAVSMLIMQEWTKAVKEGIRLGPWVMTTLAAVALQAVTDLYERPSSRIMRPSLDEPITLMNEIYYTVEATNHQHDANALAGDILAKLYKLVGIST